MKNFVAAFCALFAIATLTGCDMFNKSASAGNIDDGAVVAVKLDKEQKERALKCALCPDAKPAPQPERKAPAKRSSGCSNPIDPRIQMDINADLRALNCKEIDVDGCFGDQTRRGIERVASGVPCGTSAPPASPCGDCPVAIAEARGPGARATAEVGGGHVEAPRKEARRSSSGDSRGPRTSKCSDSRLNSHIESMDLEMAWWDDELSARVEKCCLVGVRTDHGGDVSVVSNCFSALTREDKSRALDRFHDREGFPEGAIKLGHKEDRRLEIDHGDEEDSDNNRGRRRKRH